MAREQGKAEREVGGGEDGEGFDEDVGDGLIAGEVRVELVPDALLSVKGRKSSVDDSVCGVVAFR